VNDELERMWNETVVAYYNVMSYDLPIETYKSQKRTLSIVRSSGRDSNSGHP
jgi:hypothetical protein